MYRLYRRFQEDLKGELKANNVVGNATSVSYSARRSQRRIEGCIVHIIGVMVFP